MHSDLQATTSRYNQLSEESAVLATEKSRLEDELRTLQLTAFRSLESSHWMPLDAGTISTKLENVRPSIGKFAKAYSARADALDAIFGAPTDVQLRLRSSLEHVVDFKAEGVDSLAEMRKIPQACRLCLTALISHGVHSLVLQEPFFFMISDSENNAEHGRLNSLKQTLRDVWSDGCKCETRTSM
jgi:hypothetical protein